jgi:hypothetical protein
MSCGRKAGVPTLSETERVIEQDDGFRMLAYAIYAKDGHVHLRLMTQVEIWADLGTGSPEKLWKSDAVYYSHDGSLIHGTRGASPEHRGLATLGRFLCDDRLLVSDEIDLLMYLRSLQQDAAVQKVVACFYNYGLITNDGRFLHNLRYKTCTEVMSFITGTDVSATRDNIIYQIIGTTAHMRTVVLPLATELAEKIHGPHSSSFGVHKRGMRVFV